MSNISVNSHFMIDDELQKRKQFNNLTLRMVISLLKNYALQDVAYVKTSEDFDKKNK